MSAPLAPPAPPGSPGSHPPDEVLLGLARAARVAGVPVTQDRAHTFLAAVAALGLGDPDGARRAGRATLCSSPEDLARFDQVFDAWFDPAGELPRPGPVRDRPAEQVGLDTDEQDGGSAGRDDEDPLRTAASTAEVLRHRDVARLSPAEKRRLAELFAGLRPRAPRRRTARHQPWHRGDLDVHRTLRASLRHVGEPAELLHRRRGQRNRRVVLLVDVSGSMAPYADALLRLAHRFAQSAGPGVEVFTVGTRVTRVTRAMGQRDPDRAIVAAGEAVPDWSGGTRLGESLRFFLDRWGQRGPARGAVVVVLSDGWERGDASLLGAQMGRLRRIAHRVVWVNPHRGKEGYEPVQSGVVAALPHVHDFLAGHSLATFEELTEVVARA
jgi:uncharacterized protein